MEKIEIMAEYSREDGYNFGYSGKPVGMTDIEYAQAMDSLIGAIAASLFFKRANRNSTVAKAFVDGFANSIKAMLDDVQVMELMKGEER